MALLTTQQLNAPTGIVPTFAAAAAGGDTADVSNGRTFLVVKNGGGSAVTVTLVTPGTVGGFAIADPTYSVANGGERWIGPLDPALFGTVVSISYSAVTSVTVGAVSV